MSQNPPPQQHYQSSFRGAPRGGRGRGQFRGNSRDRGSGGRGRGRGGFHHHSNNVQHTKITADVDYSPETIEARFSAFYLPSMTQDPWAHLLQDKN